MTVGWSGRRRARLWSMNCSTWITSTGSPSRCPRSQDRRRRRLSHRPPRPTSQVGRSRSGTWWPGGLPTVPAALTSNAPDHKPASTSPRLPTLAACRSASSGPPSRMSSIQLSETISTSARSGYQHRTVSHSLKQALDIFLFSTEAEVRRTSATRHVRAFAVGPGCSSVWICCGIRRFRSLFTSFKDSSGKSLLGDVDPRPQTRCPRPRSLRQRPVPLCARTESSAVAGSSRLR